MRNSTAKSSLARLLAAENIQVEYGNFPTASFNVEHRILRIPIIKDLGKDALDMFIGHEVGHALWTPEWENLPCKHSYANVVEDIRIERMIQQKYPGLVYSFNRGYEELLDRDFFKIKENNIDVNTLNLADRINVHAKVGKHIKVNFTDEEMSLVDQCFNAQTFEEVLEASKALQAWCEGKSEEKEKSKEKVDIPENEDDVGDTEDNPGNMGYNDSEGNEDITDDGEEASGGNNSEDEEAEDIHEKAGEGTDSDDNAKETDSAESTGDGASEKGEGSTEPEPIISENLAKSFEEVIDQDDTVYIKMPKLKDIEKCIYGYKEVFSKNDKAYANNNTSFANRLELKRNEYLLFKKQSDKSAAIMRKEFELRKAAFRNSRATVARKGTLNADKLHRYKMSDDIFSSVTRLADAKNHGVMIMIDYSGSMSSTLPALLKQLHTLVTFCRLINIPYEIYGFTSMWGSGEKKMRLNVGYTTVRTEDVKFFELASNRMSAAEHKRALAEMWLKSIVFSSGSMFDSLGGTPLENATFMSYRLIERMKAQYNIDNMNVIFMTDGEGSGLSTTKSCSWLSKYVCEIDGKFITIDRAKIYNTNVALKILDANIIGIYLLAGRTNPKKNLRYDYGFHKNDVINKKMKFYRKNGFVSSKREYHNEFIYMAPASEYNVKEVIMNDIAEDASKSAIKKVFGDFTSSLKKNRIFAEYLGRIIAIN